MPTWTRLIGGWVLALIVALALSWGAVSMVRGGVIDTNGAATPNVTSGSSLGEDPLITTSSQGGAANSTVLGQTPTTEGSSTQVTASSTVSSTAPTVAGSSTSSSSTSSSSTSSSSTSSTSSTTSTTTPRSLTTKTYQLIGGAVTISYAPGVVNFKAAVPQSGYATEVKDTGPDRVRVEFEKEDEHSEFEAEWVGGKLVISIDE